MEQRPKRTGSIGLDGRNGTLRRLLTMKQQHGSGCSCSRGWDELGPVGHFEMATVYLWACITLSFLAWLYVKGEYVAGG